MVVRSNTSIFPEDLMIQLLTMSAAGKAVTFSWQVFGLSQSFLFLQACDANYSPTKLLVLLRITLSEDRR